MSPVIAGLKRCRSLNWKTIPARQVERLSDDELRAIELDENSAREALSTFEASKARLAQIRQAEADLKAKPLERISVSTGNKNQVVVGRVGARVDSNRRLRLKLVFLQRTGYAPSGTSSSRSGSRSCSGPGGAPSCPRRW